MTKRRRFAEGTTTSIATSRAEIENILSKHGATSIGVLWSDQLAQILFEAHGRRVRFSLELLSPTVDRSARAAKENMRRWRCLAFVLKAKLEAVADGLVTFEEEFLAQIVIPGSSGETIGQWVGPQIAAAYERGIGLPPLLPQST